MNTWLVLLVAFWVAVAIFGWISGKAHKIKENEENRKLRLELEQKTNELTVREETFNAMKAAFQNGVIQGRQWLAGFVAEAYKAADEDIAYHLRTKKHPAIKAAEAVKAANDEKREKIKQIKYLEYQLKSYKEYFPFLEDYEDIILDEQIELKSFSDENKNVVEDLDPVLSFVPKEEYEKLPSAQRNQLALTRYLSKPFGSTGIGRFYERYLGYLYEKDGWRVEYRGIIDGYEDMGRDLICKRGDDIHIVQAKCWSINKTVHEKHIFQLFGTTQLYLMDIGKKDLVGCRVKPRFITATKCSDVAKKAGEWLGIEIVQNYPLNKNYPMIKCNINQSTGEKIYHLPFDQQYDRVVINPSFGEFYAKTASEAEAAGFRRAYRFTGLKGQQK